MIKGIARLIVALNANTRPGEIAAGADLATAGSYGQVLATAQKESEKKLKGAIPLPKLTF
ncbi:MAG: hypothetical protein NT005_09080 [Spirochaetes bacterium]|nr:hypothetical protein [Spirochaetota bacterium]